MEQRLLHPLRRPLLLLLGTLGLAPARRALELVGPLLVLEHGHALQRRRCSIVRVGAAIKKDLHNSSCLAVGRCTGRGQALGGRGSYLNYIIQLLEDGSGKRALPLVVEPVGVRAVLYQEFDYVCVAVICGEHELCRPRWLVHTHGGGPRTPGPRDPGGMPTRRELTSVSPFSLVRFGGMPSRMAVSMTCLFPSRAALYICAANLMASRDGEKAVAEVSWLDMMMFRVPVVSGEDVGSLTGGDLIMQRR